jgi:GntR family transcriptional repressor for pyruvate dehydrogenase complex
MDAFEPVSKQRLSDGLAHRVNRLILEGDFEPGDRLPSITEMASRFGVGHATLREALKKLETIGVVSIRHGSGIYVSENPDALLITNPIAGAAPSKKLLLDLIEARLVIEPRTASLAAEHATTVHLEQMERVLLTESQLNADSEDIRKPTKMAFHRQVAEASGNDVFAQILEVISNLFQREQEMILNIYSSRRNDLAEHQTILEAIKDKNDALAAKEMSVHLKGVREILLQWNPLENPVD